jgi:hypothetical protein
MGDDQLVTPLSKHTCGELYFSLVLCVGHDDWLPDLSESPSCEFRPKNQLRPGIGRVTTARRQAEGPVSDGEMILERLKSLTPILFGTLGLRCHPMELRIRLLNGLGLLFNRHIRSLMFGWVDARLTNPRIPSPTR